MAEKLKDVVDANSIVLARHNPNDLPFVERFFGVLEEAGFHRLPNTTRSSPKDSRRKNPELAAVKYSIQLEHLEDLVDVLIANSSSTPHGGIGYRTPLEYLESLCAKEGSWPRQADPSKVERILSFYKTVSVRGGADTGRRPFVNLFGVKYSSDVLRQAYDLLGKKLVEQSDPVMALLEHLEKMAIQGKTVPPLYLQVRKLFTQHLSEFHTDTAQEQTETTPATRLNIGETEAPPATLSIPKFQRSLEPALRRKTVNG